MTYTDKIKEEFKNLKTLNGQEAEAILEDGTKLSDWWLSKITDQRREIREMLESKKTDHVKSGKNVSHEKDELWCCLDCADDSVRNELVCAILSDPLLAEDK